MTTFLLNLFFLHCLKNDKHCHGTNIIRTNKTETDSKSFIVSSCDRMNVNGQSEASSEDCNLILFLISDSASGCLQGASQNDNITLCAACQLCELFSNKLIKLNR